MPRRAALITQADIARAIRAVQAQGLPVVRVVVRPDGVSVETIERAVPRDEHELGPDESVADSEPLVLL